MPRQTGLCGPYPNRITTRPTNPLRTYTTTRIRAALERTIAKPARRASWILERSLWTGTEIVYLAGPPLVEIGAPFGMSSRPRLRAISSNSATPIRLGERRDPRRRDHSLTIRRLRQPAAFGPEPRNAHRRGANLLAKRPCSDPPASPDTTP